MSEPFLTYLTVFKSRLAIANLIVSITGFGHQPTEALMRKLRQATERREPLAVDDVSNDNVFEYLLDKRIVSSESRESGRYRGLQLQRSGRGAWIAMRGGEGLAALPVYLIDIWMSDPALASTVGAPTPDNVQEMLELAFQFRLLSRSKNTWTSAGHLVRQLRDLPGHGSGDQTNPFLLGLEATALFRQVIEADGLIMRELVREICGIGERVTRDLVAQRFAAIVDRAVESAKVLKVQRPEARKIRDFSALIHRTLERRPLGSRAPGVLEHRVSPRLEWLTDLGYLSKIGLPKNGFDYVVDSSCQGLISELDSRFGEATWSDSVAVWDWRTHARWDHMRSSLATADNDERFRRAYRTMKRRVGPSPLREVAFVSALLSSGDADYPQSMEQLIEFAKATEGASLSGGRFSRVPENIYIPDGELGDT
jgi:hypothetical protein